MDNGCPKCKEILDKAKWLHFDHSKNLCIDCRIEQAEHDVLRDMNIVEELKKEKENELNSQARATNGTD